MEALYLAHTIIGLSQQHYFSSATSAKAVMGEMERGLRRQGMLGRRGWPGGVKEGEVAKALREPNYHLSPPFSSTAFVEIEHLSAAEL